MSDAATVEIPPPPPAYHSESDLSTLPYPPTPTHLHRPQQPEVDVQNDQTPYLTKFKPRGLYSPWHLLLNWFAWLMYVGGLCFMACWFSMNDSIELPIKILLFVGGILVGQFVFISYAKFVWRFCAQDCGYIPLLALGQILGPVLLVGIIHASYMGKV